MFDADRPIISAEQDRLNRSVFAKYLARCLLDHHEPESLAMGLYGGYGVGKTSLINLIIEELRVAGNNMLEEESPIILNFSAWSYSGQGQLIYSFFRRLSSTLRNVPDLKNRQRIIHLLELYVSFFTRQPVPRALRTPQSWWEKITFQHREEIFAWESGRDLTVIKAELNTLLSQLNRKIIIFIDNISRLYPEEIRQIFQIVKSMGDYVNTIYLLSMDKPQVVRALNELSARTGESIVEKIIQLPFDVPPILQQDLEKILADRLSDVIAIVPEDAWNKEYWADIYYGALKYFFQHCRDITRYVNALSFSYSRLRDIVNPVDFFAITAIEVFTPHIYAGIRENKDLFSDLLDNVYVLTPEQISREKMRCDEIISRSERLPSETLLALLIKLFPRLRHIYQPDTVFYYSDAMAHMQKRLSSPDFFDAYFRLSMHTNQVTQAEFENLLALSKDENSFDQALNRLNQDNRINGFLDLLDGPALNTLPLKSTAVIIDTLLDNGDLFPSPPSGPLSFDVPTRIHRIIHTLLRRVDSFQERFALLQHGIANATKSLFILVHEIAAQSYEHSEESDTFVPLEFRDLTPEHLDSLQKLVVSRIEYWANHESLATHPKLLRILYAWKNWGDQGKCQAFVETMVSTDKGLLLFLTAILDAAITEAMTRYEKNPQWDVYLDEMRNFIAVERLIGPTKKIFESDEFEKLDEREQLAVMIFLDLMHVNVQKIIPKTSA